MSMTWKNATLSELWISVVSRRIWMLGVDYTCMIDLGEARRY
jgi:hypothetical protein